MRKPQHHRIPAPGEFSQPSLRPPLWACKILLVVIFLALLDVGTRAGKWPVLPWVMYGTSRLSPPTHRVTVDQLRLVDEAGAESRYLPDEFLSREADTVIRDLIERAFDDSYPAHEEFRTALVDLARHRFPELRLARIERWQLHWDTNPRRPLEFDREFPSGQRLMGSFAVPPLLAEARAR